MSINGHAHMSLSSSPLALLVLFQVAGEVLQTPSLELPQRKGCNMIEVTLETNEL